MLCEPEKYEFCFSEEIGDWYVVHHQWKNGVLHRNILAERYESEREAMSAINKKQQAC